MNTKLLTYDLATAARALKNGETTSVELTESCFAQIKSADPELGSLLWQNPESSLKAARASDERRQKDQTLGELDGIPVSVKDMILATDFPCTAGSRILEGFMPPYNATVVEKLLAQGAVILGKTNQDEFAFGSSNESSGYKICRNPWDPKRTPGGSSGGSAANVSAGMSFMSLGTDTGGSIRQPAAYCGLVGLKPTYGRVSRFGVVAFASSLDQVGPFARTVAGCAQSLKAIAGYDPHDATSVDVPVPDYVANLKTDVKGRKVGVPKEYFVDGIDDAVRESVVRSIDILRKNGAEIVEISLPHTKYAVATYYIIATAEASSNLSRYDGIRFGPQLNEKGDLQSLYETTRGTLFGDEVKRRIILGTYVLSAGYYDAYYLKAQKVRRLFAEDFLAAFKKVDVIISPTTPTTAFKLGEKVDDPLSMYLNDIFTISANLSGICGLSLPTGFDQNHMPIGTQLMGRPFDEQSVFDFAQVLESELNLSLVPGIVS
jgi:aspartyl-tRNA(Asn)/glutamyl-tRNA(Gln) amidotransferase subunit A